MLVLSRKRDEAVRITGPAVVRVVDIRGDKVRLGIDADQSVRIAREELAPLTAEELQLVNMVLDRRSY